MIMDLVDSAMGFVRGHLSEISFGITAVALMLFGRPVNSVVKKFTKGVNWFFRYCIYILLCTVGYGLLTRFLYRSLITWFRGLEDPALILIVTSIYLLLAWIAKAQKEI
ncbi:hypothetical protein CHISP_1767 [Chitinispirillum alkaliphilum]|nr:hypothetical protein CHISP_1767 [Chitinispirillum alkaliphilum]